MTREELFRAVGEVREDQVTEAETTEKRRISWRRYGALAACLAVVLAAGVGRGWLSRSGQDLPVMEQAETADAGELDGSDYSVPEDAPAQPIYSVGAEIGEFDGPGDGSTMIDSAACLARLEPEEIFAQDTVIFRGTVRNLRYFVVTAGQETQYYTVASVEVTGCVRGGLGTGDIYNVLYAGAAGRESSSIAGDLERLEVGSDAVFMPYRATADTGWNSGEDYFCYADLAELYFDEGIRFLFLDTGDGLSFERDVYADIADAETLDEVMDYLRENVPNAGRPPEAAEVFEAAGETPESAQPARFPAEPQAEPSVTAQAAGEEAQSGPAGARELPGGAVSGELMICG